MKKPEAMMFYPEAWKASVGVSTMDPVARAGYFDILCSMWLDGGSLPDDDRTLRACSRLDRKSWSAVSDQIRAELTPTEDGRLTQARLAEEYGRTIDLQERRRSAGKKGSRRRWQSHGGANGKPNSKAMAEPKQSHGFANAEAIETETETETKRKLAAGAASQRPPASQPAAALDPVLDAIAEAAGRRPSPEDLPPDLALLVADHGPEPVVEWIRLRARQGVRSPGLFLQPSVISEIRAHVERRKRSRSAPARRAEESPDHYPPEDLAAALEVPGGAEAFRGYCRRCGWVEAKCKCEAKSA